MKSLVVCTDYRISWCRRHEVDGLQCWTDGRCRPVSLHVTLQRAGVREPQTTHGADERLLAGVNAHVSAQVAGNGEGAVADGAQERLVTEMHRALVTLQPGRAVEAHRAVGTDERPFSAVRARVHLESAEGAEGARTVGARVWSRVGVHAGV